MAIVGFFKFGAHFVDKMRASTVIDLFAKENKGFLPKKTLSTAAFRARASPLRIYWSEQRTKKGT